MRKIITLLAVVLPISLLCQIPNPDFELWQTINKDKPLSWGVFGSTKKVIGQNGSFAVRLERDLSNPNSPGAVIYGNPESNFSGGIAFKGRPDSALFNIKRHLVTGDSAWFLVYLIRNGQKISQDNFKFSGSDTSKFVRMAFKIQYKDTGLSDSLLIGVSSTNPESQFQGSFVILDNIGFSGGIFQAVPNGDFEQWETISYDVPNGWTVSSLNNQTGLNNTSISKTSDAALHQYAVKIQNTPYNQEFIQAYIMAGKQGQNGPLPGFAVNNRDTVLYAYYKCQPVNGDKVNIGVMMFDAGQIVGSGYLRQSFAITSWSQTPITIDYYNGYTGTPDSAVIYCSAFEGGDEAHGASILWVDGLKFNAPFVSVNTITEQLGLLTIYPNPCNIQLNITYTGQPDSQLNFLLYDQLGRVVNTYQIQPERLGLNYFTIETDTLEDGIYSLEMCSNQYRITKSIKIQH